MILIVSVPPHREHNPRGFSWPRGDVTDAAQGRRWFTMRRSQPAAAGPRIPCHEGRWHPERLADGSQASGHIRFGGWPPREGCPSLQPLGGAGCAQHSFLNCSWPAGGIACPSWWSGLRISSGLEERLSCLGGLPDRGAARCAVHVVQPGRPSAQPGRHGALACAGRPCPATR